MEQGKTETKGEKNPIPAERNIGGVLQGVHARRRVPMTGAESAISMAREHFMGREFTSANVISFFNRLGVHIKMGQDEEHSGLFSINDDATPIRGIVVDANDYFKILVAPQPDVVKTETAISFCCANIGEYDIYRAVDGTRITLYYVARLNAWLMATPGLYDARNYRWMGSKTFAQIFAECVAIYAKEGDGDFFARLDPAYTYTFICRHHDHQPLERDPNALWQVSGPELAGIPQYKTQIITDVSPERLRILASRAFIEYARTGECNYGYVFRARSQIHPRAVFMESSLYEFVRRHIYDLPNTVALTPDTRATYIHLRGYMSFGSSHEHLLVFPCAAEVYDRMDLLIGLLTDATVEGMRAAPGHSISIETLYGERMKVGATLFGTAWPLVRNRIATICRETAKKLLAARVISASGPHIHTNIRDQFLSVANMPEFMDMLIMRP